MDYDFIITANREYRYWKENFFTIYFMVDSLIAIFFRLFSHIVQLVLIILLIIFGIYALIKIAAFERYKGFGILSVISRFINKLFLGIVFISLIHFVGGFLSLAWSGIRSSGYGMIFGPPQITNTMKDDYLYIVHICLYIFLFSFLMFYITGVILDKILLMASQKRSLENRGDYFIIESEEYIIKHDLVSKRSSTYDIYLEDILDNANDCFLYSGNLIKQKNGE